MTDTKKPSQQEGDGREDESVPSEQIDGAADHKNNVSTDSRRSPSRRRLGGWLTALILLVVMGVVAQTYFPGPVSHWLSALPGVGPDPKISQLAGQLTQLERGLAETRTELRSIHQLASDNEKLNQELDDRLEVLATQQEDYHQHVNERLTEFNHTMGRQMSGWRPVEVRHLLFLADTRLHLVGDLDGATVALRRADGMLQETGERRWLPLREKILAALTALNGVERVDIEGVRIRLRLLENQIVALSGFPQLSSDPDQVSGESIGASGEVAGNPADSGTDDWRSRLTAAWERITAELAGYFTVYHADEEVLPALSHPQIQGLKFQLVGELRLAEAALLRADPEYYLRLAQVDEQLGQYFDVAGQATRVIRRELKALQAVVVTPELPDISEPLRWLDQELDDQALSNG